jgi:hypothetical protein
MWMLHEWRKLFLRTDRTQLEICHCTEIVCLNCTQRRPWWNWDTVEFMHTGYQNVWPKNTKINCSRWLFFYNFSVLKNKETEFLQSTDRWNMGAPVYSWGVGGGAEQAGMQWRHPSSPGAKTFKVCQSAEKGVACLFWDVEGLMHVKFCFGTQSLTWTPTATTAWCISQTGHLSQAVILEHDSAVPRSARRKRVAAVTSLGNCGPSTL